MHGVNGGGGIRRDTDIQKQRYERRETLKEFLVFHINFRKIRHSSFCTKETESQDEFVTVPPSHPFSLTKLRFFYIKFYSDYAYLERTLRKVRCQEYA